MGNMGSSHTRRRNSNRRRNDPRTPPPPPQPPTPNRYVFAAATPYPNNNNNNNNPSSNYPNNPNNNPYYQYPPGYYPPPSTAPLPAPYDHHNNNNYQRYPYGPMMMMQQPPPIPPTPYVEHQKAVTIRNDVNLKKETLRIEPDDQDNGKFLVSFTFDATVPGSITIIFFAKEGEDCSLTPSKEDLHQAVTVQFEKGLAQKFKQPSGTGIDFSMFDESELSKDKDMDIYPLAVKAEACPVDQNDNSENVSTNSQITQAVFEKDRGEYRVRVVKQILWVNGMRYELQEIYGIGNSVEDGDFDANDPGKECVICLSEPRDTTVLPCRHMCMCSECAKVLRFQTNRCPICRQPVERLLEIKVNNGTEEE